MKFTHQLKFNSVPEWREHYVQYGHLKKYIYALAKWEADHPHEQPGAVSVGDIESLSAPLLSGTGSQQGPTEEGFMREMDASLAEVIRFFNVKEAEFISKCQALQLELSTLEKIPNNPHQSGAATPTGSTTPSAGFSQQGVAARLLGRQGRGSSNGTPEAARLLGDIPPSPSYMALAEIAEVKDRRSVRVEFWRKPPRRLFQNLHNARTKLGPRFQELYIALHDLAEFLHLNREGLRKICKKHDKLTRSVELKSKWWPRVDQLLPASRKEEVEKAMAELVDNYAVLFTEGDVPTAQQALNQGLRDYVTVERNTVWRDMAAMERKFTSMAVKTAAAAGGKVPWWVDNMRWIKLSVCLLAFSLLLNIDFFPEEEKNNCLAVLVFCSMLWSLEAIPLFVTSMLLPFLIVWFELLVDHTKDPPVRMTPQQAAPAIFHAMFSQVIMLLLGGFAIAAALSKHAIAKQLAVAVLSRVGRKPHNVLLACMFVATFASMWISNVAAPVLCFGLIQPILRTLDPGHPFSKCLVMGIALASNVGGMTSPISSPQNIFAIERMSGDGHPPSWLSWFAVAIPVSVLSNLICWGLLLAVYRPWTRIKEVRPVKPNTDPINATQVYIIVVSVITVAMWCGNTVLQKYTGEMGIIAIVPLVAFFGFDVLRKDDFNSFLWNVVMLAMGGLALGEAVKSSGLLYEIAVAIKGVVEGLDLWGVCVVFCLMVLVATTFISHTVGAMVILPIVQQVGEAMPGQPHPKLLVMAAALMCSGAMGLPVSGFPNMNAVAQEDATGNAIVNTLDFLMAGVPSSVFAYGVIVTLGYALMLVMGF